MVYYDKNCTFNELIEIDGYFSIHYRSSQKLAAEMFKGYKGLSPKRIN